MEILKKFLEKNKINEPPLIGLISISNGFNPAILAASEMLLIEW